METFIIKLAVAVIPFLSLITLFAIRGHRTPAPARSRSRRNRAAATRAYAVAATTRWL
jgi:hypothetical protein